MLTSRPKPKPSPQLAKVATGIQGLDEITDGGLPKGRPTLVCGGAGCGKTLLAMEFLVNGATEFDEPGVFMAEESAHDLTQNVASLGFYLNDLVARKKIVLGCSELDVIDLYQQPQLAQGDQIIAVPTLIKKLLPPLRRIIGDLSDTARVLVGLDIRSKA